MYSLCGFEKVEYTNKSGRLVRGVRLHCNYSSERINGYGCETFFVPERVVVPSDLTLGDELDVFFSRYGSVASVVKVS